MAEMLSPIRKGIITLERKYIDDYNFTSYITVIAGIIDSSIDIIFPIDPILRLYCWLGFLILWACHRIVYEYFKESHPYESWKDTTWFIGLVLWIILLFGIWGVFVPDRLIFKELYLIVLFSFVTIYSILAIYEVSLYWKANLTLPMVNVEHKSKKFYTIFYFFISVILILGVFLFVVSFLSSEQGIVDFKSNW